MQARRWEALAGAFTPEQRLRLDGLFEVDDALNLEALRQPPQRFGPTELTRHLERTGAIRVLGLAPETAPAVPEAVIDRLARSARRVRLTALARLPEPRRTAMLAALFHALEGIALDDALDLFDQLVEQSVRDAKRRYDAGRLRSLRDLDAAALLAARAAGVVVAEAASEVEQAAARTEFLDEIPTEAIREAIERIERLARPPDDRHFAELCDHWRRLSRLFAQLLARVRFDVAPAAEPVREALAFLAGRGAWTRMNAAEAPTACIAAGWRRHIFGKATKDPDVRVADNRAYVFAVLEVTRRALRRRDLHVAQSLRFANPARRLR